MIVQLNTDKNIQGTDNLESYVTERIEGVLKHLTDHITRIEVHLTDQNADKSGPDDNQCKLEARLEGRQPIVVTSVADTREKALDDAAKKLKASLTTIVGKMKEH